MQKIARHNLQARDFDRQINSRDMRVGMRDRNVAREKLETEALDFGKIAHGAVRHHRHRTHRLQNGGVRFSDKSGRADTTVGILNHDNMRRRAFGQFIPPIGAIGKRFSSPSEDLRHAVAG